MAQDPTAPLRRQLVEQLSKAGAIRSPAVARAFARVPRHVFVPDHPMHLVYSDRALITKARAGVVTSSSSQPEIMAVMLEQLRVRRGMNVLEIGAGSGYNAAILAELTGPDGAVATMDIQADVATKARRALRSAGYGDVRVVRGDGAKGMRAAAPFDRIIATAGCWEIPRAWFQQLAPGGIIVMPLRLNLSHAALALRRRGDEPVSLASAPCGFMPLQGSRGRRLRRRLGSRDIAMYVQHDYRGLRLRAGRLEALLRTPPRRVAIPELKSILQFPASWDFATYLSLQGMPLVGVGGASEGAFETGPVDTTLPSLCLLSPADLVRGEVIAYGTDDAAEAARDHLARWTALGRPAVRDLRMRVRWDRGTAPELPQPMPDGTYRFRRGGASFTAWYQ